MEIALHVHVVVRRISSNISGFTGSIFAIFSSYESALCANDGSVHGAPIKNNPLANILCFSHGSTNLRQTFRLCMQIFTQHILQILLT